MHGRLALALLAACMLVSNAIAQSQSVQQRTQPQQHQPAQPQENAAPDQRGTKQSPLAVEIVPTPKSQQETERDDNERREKAELDRKLVDFNGKLAEYTLGIGIVAVLQFFALVIQAVVLGKTLTATNHALQTTERAFVFLNEFFPDFQFSYPHGTNQRPLVRNLVIRPQWRNSGTTPTVAGKLTVGWNHFDDLAIPPDFKYDYQSTPSPLFLGPQGQEWSAPIEIPDNVVTRAVAAQTNILIYGRIDYEDVFKRPHFSEWCYRLIFYNVQAAIRAQFVAFGPHNRTDADSA